MRWWAVLFVSALSAEQTSGGNPVARITQLLNDLKMQVSKEGDEEKHLYDKFMCWCDAGKAESASAIADQKARIEELVPAIDQAQQRVKELTEQVHEADKELELHRQAQQTSDALRAKEAEQFAEDSSVLQQSVSQLNKAIAVMQKARDVGAFAQVSGDVKAALAPHSADPRVRTALEDREIQALLQGSQSFLQVNQRTGGVEHVLGVLVGLRDGFAQNLAESEKQEKQSKEAYEGLASSKAAELLAAEQTHRSVTQEKTGLSSQLARDRDDLGLTQVSYAQDSKAHAERIQQCTTKTAEFHERQQARLGELLAISEAIQVLVENMHVLAKANDVQLGESTPCAVPLECPLPAFVQLSEKTNPADVLEHLQKLAKANPENNMLSLLATKLTQMSGQNFDRVLQVIRKQIELIDMDQVQDDTKKQWCTTEITKNEQLKESKKKEGETLKVELGTVEGSLTGLRAESAGLKRELQDMDRQLEDAQRNRADESKGFDETIAEVKMAQAALVKAIQVLQAFYGQEGAAHAALVEQTLARQAEAASALLDGQEEQAPPTPSGEYAGAPGASNILKLLAQVGEDLVHQEEVGRAEEATAAKDFQQLQSETALMRNMKSEQMLSRREQIARLEQQQVGVESDMEDVAGTVETLQKRRVDLASSCAILQSYEKRKELRSGERDAMHKAISILT